MINQRTFLVARGKGWVTFVARVEQVFSEVTAENPLPQDTAFLQLTPGRAGQDETPGERDGAEVGHDKSVWQLT